MSEDLKKKFADWMVSKFLGKLKNNFQKVKKFKNF